MTTLNGRLSEGVVANVLQYLALSQATGCLALVHPERRQGRVYLENGVIVLVEARPLYDLAAMAAMLEWREGRFTFRPGEAPKRKTMSRNADTLLLEASHLVDTGEVARGPSAAADTVLHVAESRDRDESVMLTLAALHLWRTIDGVSSLRQLAATIGKPVEETVAAAQELLDNGLAGFATLAVADPRFVREVARETIDLMGPVGSIVVEDALMDLGVGPDTLPVSAAGEFLEEVARAIHSSERRAEFLRRATELRRLFSLDQQARGGRSDVDARKGGRGGSGRNGSARTDVARESDRTDAAARGEPKDRGPARGDSATRPRRKP